MSIEQRLDRFHSKKWGIFIHFLGGHEADTWNARVNAVDVDLWAQQLAALGCGFFGITMMQVTQLMLAPNATFDRITGYKPGQACATRDLILDLSDALRKYDIDLMLYFTGDGPCRDKNGIADKAFGYTTTTPVKIDGKWHIETFPEFVPLDFVKKWSAVLEEYAVRYGERVFAWWIDGCSRSLYANDTREDYLRYYVDAARRGNPDVLLSFNGGFNNRKNARSSVHENFTGGETGELLRPPTERYVDGSQWFEFLCNQFWWAGGDRSTGIWTGTERNERIPRFTPEQLRDHVAAVNAGGGIVMFDTLFVDDRLIQPDQAYMLSKLKELR